MNLTISWISCTCIYSQDLKITTNSSTEYSTDQRFSIYPAFVDGLHYQSWTESGAKPYYQLHAEGGHAPLKWTLQAGKLPDGLSLSLDGKITGVPLKEGKFTFDVNVTDLLGKSSIKRLTMQAEPYRSKWLTEAKFGIMIAWGPFTEPILYTKADINQFETRISEFNADEWANAIVSLGGKVLNFTVKGGDGIRLWPSSTPSKYELKTNRNIVGELITACHKRNIKFVAYFAPDHGWNKKVNDVADDGTWGKLNIGLVRELISMGVDGFWLDMGASPEFYSSVDPTWFPWDKIIPIMRTQNPYLTFANNPGLGNGGAVLRWPNTDIIVYEGGMAPDSGVLKIAKPSTLRKKVAIEVDNLLDNQWSWFPSKGIPSAPKSAVTIIESIKKNWEAGATYMLNYPIPPSGQILPEPYHRILQSIGEFVKKNSAYYPPPQSSLRTDIFYSTPQSLKITSSTSRPIFFTTDGSKPSANSKIYSTPIKISRPTRVRALVFSNEGLPSAEMDNSYMFEGKTLKLNSYQSLKSLQTTRYEKKKEKNNYYRGVKVTIGSTPLLLHAVGRRYMNSNENKHDIQIMRYWDDHPLVNTTIDTKSFFKYPDGFQYVQIPPLKLEAGKSYTIVSKEDSTDFFAASPITQDQVFPYLTIRDSHVLNSIGHKRNMLNDKIGTNLNLVYTPLHNESTSNIAIGSKTYMQDNHGNILNPARAIHYSENAVDGDLKTMAQAGGKYGWTLLVELTKSYDNIKSAQIIFDKTEFATEYLIQYSNDNKVWKVAYHKTNNLSINQKLVFTPFKAKFLRIRSIKPDGPNQLGNQMGIREFQIFQ